MFSSFSWPRLALLMALLTFFAGPSRAQEPAPKLAALEVAPRTFQEQKGKPKKGDGPERPKPKPGPRDGDDE